MKWYEFQENIRRMHPTYYISFCTICENKTVFRPLNASIDICTECLEAKTELKDFIDELESVVRCINQDDLKLTTLKFMFEELRGRVL